MQWLPVGEVKGCVHQIGALIWLTPVFDESFHMCSHAVGDIEKVAFNEPSTPVVFMRSFTVGTCTAETNFCLG